MHLALRRFSTSEDSTIGLLFIDWTWECFTLEDSYREVKIMGETRIPNGEYEIDYRTEDSPLTKKYRKRFSWFRYHLELKNVPGYKYVYIHIGNEPGDTEACILVGDTCVNNRHADGFIGQSTACYKRLYQKIDEALFGGENVTISIEDMER